MKIIDCRMNHMDNPLGYQLDNPDFSWRLDGETSERVSDTRISICKEGMEAGDTGWTDPDNLGTSVAALLEPRTRYTWKVAVKMDDGSVVESGENWFETGKMEEPWSGKWITMENQKEARHPVFHKHFTCDKEIKRARLYITGLGLYEATINGKPVTDECLTPYCNAYDQWLQVQTYDVTDLLQKDNEIDVMLGNGWYRGRFGFDQSEEPAYGSTWKLIAELVVTDKDGNETVIPTDESWSVTRSKITFSNLYDGEHVDMTLPDTEEEKVVFCNEESAPLMDRMSTAVRRHEMFRGKIIITPKKEMVVDIGQNLAGTFALHVHEPKGTKIHLQFGEVLQDGCFYRDNLRTAKAEYFYVSDGEERWISPHFTFYGFRYVKVEGMSKFKAEDFVAYALYSDIHDVSTLKTGHDLVNRLIGCAEWGMKSNFLDVPTDCPQRDERMGWTGDAQVFSRTAMYLADTYAFYAKYLYDMAKEQAAWNGLVPHVVPSFHIHEAAAVWGDATTIIPWNMYQFYGDARILADHYEAMKAWVDYVHAREEDNHGWTKQFHFGDWLALDGEKSKEGVRGLTDEAFIAAVYYRKSAMIVSETARILGLTEDGEKYEQLAEDIKKEILKEWYTATGRCAITTMTAQLLSLNECIGDPYIAKDELAKLIRFNNGKLATGFVGTPLLCPVLTEYGMEKMAYDLLFNEDYPGWLYEVKLGATTVWERWNSLDEDGHITGVGMNSLNHYAYGSIVEWIYAYCAGIKQMKPGFKRAIIEPVVDYRLKYVDCKYNSAAGPYEVHWKIIDRWHMHMEWSVPYGCGAEVHLPFYKDTDSPIKEQLKNGFGYFTQGTYSLDYETEEPLDQVIAISSMVKEALNVPAVRDYLEKLPRFKQSEFSFMGSTIKEALQSCPINKEDYQRIEKEIIDLQ